MDPTRIKRKIERYEKLLKREELAQSTTEKLAASTKARIIKNLPLSSTISRPKVLLEKIAKSRYHKMHGVDKISLTGMAILARRIHPTEWDAVIQYSDVREDILSHLNSLPRDLEACMSFLTSLFRAKSEWARFYLLGTTVRQIKVDTNERLELAYEEWQTDIPTLFSTILHLENDGTIPLEHDENEDIRETAGAIKASNPRKRKRALSLSESDGVPDGLTSETTTGDLSGSTVIPNASSPAPKDKRRLIVEHVRAQGLGTQKQKLALGYLSNMSAEAIDDLYISIFNGLGMDRHEITHAIIDIWGALGKAEMSLVEDTLALPTSVQITADVGGDGDFEVKIKLPRIEGLALISKYTWPIHADAVFPSL